MKKKKDFFVEDVVRDVQSDFAERRESRRPFELIWRMNLNYLAGNQYCYIAPSGEIEDNERGYFWQQREVYNHLSAIFESRLSKLGRVRPKMSVLPVSADDSDVYAAKVGTRILNAAFFRHNMDDIISKATMWSEVAGTSFYKLSWDSVGGRNIGSLEEPVYEGEIGVDVCPPFEIYPSNNYASEMSEQESVIHAKAYTVESVKRIYGVDVEPESVDMCYLDSKLMGGGLGYSAGVNTFTRESKQGYAMVIERYERPTSEFPCGRLIIVCGDKLLYYGDLPYLNGVDGGRDFPFIRQLSLEQPAQFWGVSVLERAIPIQRAYNAVKNRKHEFLNRVSVGVLAVEDGSIDTESLEEEGLSPGKVLVYRQGSNPPHVLNPDRVPPEFNYEEERLLSEFVTVTGVSEIMRNSSVPNSVVSGVAIQLLIEQDDTRLTVTAELIRKAVKGIGQHIIRLYRQFATALRCARIVGAEGSVELMYWQASDLLSDDIAFITENELSSTPASKRSMIFDLLRTGLLTDENGALSNEMRAKILDLLGFGIWENAHEITDMQRKRAVKENHLLLKGDVDCEDYDDHKVHIAEHTRFLLSGECGEIDKLVKDRFAQHMRLHKAIEQGVGVGAADSLGSVDI